MKRNWHFVHGPLVCAAVMAVVGAVPVFGAEQSERMEWIEPATGHRVVRLSTEPGSSSYYFHQNAYTASGDKLLISTPEGLATVKLATRQMDLVLPGRAAQVVVGRNSRQVYYTQSNVVCATDLDSHATRVIATLPGDFGRGSGLAVNADETLLAGSYVKGGSYTNLYPSPDESPGMKPVQPGSGGRLEARFDQHLPMGLFTINIKSGEINTFNASTDWENHVQFSPTDPTLLMFCHEGPWHKVDRIWTIRTDGTGLRKIHTRTMDMEIAGHEFFSADGKIIWYDLQTPKGREFWLAGAVIATGEQIRYKVQRDQWSVHYNVSRDGKLFSGDGGGPNSVAAPGNGQWMYLFHPENGGLKGERLVDLSKHDYNLEPNGTFTPDGKWIVFRSNMHGVTQVYAVEVAKSVDTKSLN